MIKELKTWLRKIKKDGNPMPLYRSGWDLGMSNAPSNVVWFNSLTTGTETGGTGTNDSVTSREEKKLDERIAKKPVEVYGELVAETPEMNLVGLDPQIALVKRRLKMFEELGVNPVDELEALGFLEARKRGLKNKVSFRWAPTTLSLVNALVMKYKLSYVDFYGYAKNIPMEAIDELEAFIEEYSKVRDDKPLLKLIIDDEPAPGQKVSAERKKDPILLASSPFGKFFYILGAWDKEVQIVDDLVYHGK